MNPVISELLGRIRQIEEEIEQEFKRRRTELHTDFEHRRICFERNVLLRYWESNPLLKANTPLARITNNKLTVERKSWAI